MAKKTDKLEWYGADRQTSDGGKTTTAQMQSVSGKSFLVKTSGKDDRIAELTARYKLMRSAADLSPADDKATWEQRRDIAFCEMQLERYTQQLEKYQARPNARPDQIKLYQERIDGMRGRWLRLIGQDAVPGADIHVVTRKRG